MASDRDKFDSKPRTGSSVKHIPKDAQVIMSILKDLNITDYEPRVINQLLEFTYRYVTCILDDAKIFANHAKKKIIELDDIKIASEMTLDKAFTSPPPRDVLLEIARAKNAEPLPLVRSNCGLRLPPDRHCLLAPNYKLRAAVILPKKPTRTTLDRSCMKNKSTGAATLKRQAIATNPRIQSVTIPKPVFKFARNTTVKTSSTPTFVQNPLRNVHEVKMEIDDDYSSGDLRSMKRKREEEDDFEVVQ